MFGLRFGRLSESIEPLFSHCIDYCVFAMLHDLPSFAVAFVYFQLSILSLLRYPGSVEL